MGNVSQHIGRWQCIKLEALPFSRNFLAAVCLVSAITYWA